jgi:transcription elongation factor Elf1
MKKYGISTRECSSMRSLARDGWTVGDLKMTFNLSDNKQVYYHVGGHCSHQHGYPPIRDWDGQTKPPKVTSSARQKNLEKLGECMSDKDNHYEMPVGCPECGAIKCSVLVSVKDGTVRVECDSCGFLDKVVVDYGEGLDIHSKGGGVNG